MRVKSIYEFSFTISRSARCVYGIHADMLDLIHSAHSQSDIGLYSNSIRTEVRMLQSMGSSKTSFGRTQKKKKNAPNLFRFVYVSEIASATGVLIYLTTIISDEIVAMNVLYLLYMKNRKKLRLNVYNIHKNQLYLLPVCFYRQLRRTFFQTLLLLMR